MTADDQALAGGISDLNCDLNYRGVFEIAKAILGTGPQIWLEHCNLHHVDLCTAQKPNLFQGENIGPLPVDLASLDTCC